LTANSRSCPVNLSDIISGKIQKLCPGNPKTELNKETGGKRLYFYLYVAVLGNIDLGELKEKSKTSKRLIRCF